LRTNARGDVPGEHRRAADVHRPQAIDDAAGHVLTDGHRGQPGVVGRAQHQDAGHHVGDIAPTGLDRAAEQLHEHEHEQQGNSRDMISAST